VELEVSGEGLAWVYRTMSGNNSPPNTVLHAWETGYLCSTRLRNGENGVPVGQNVANLSLTFESLEELVNRLSHGNWWKFASIVRRRSDTAELEITSSAYRGNTVKGITFSSMAAKGPPPPSPLPNTRSALSVDSIF